MIYLQRYANDPKIRASTEDTKRALREVLNTYFSGPEVALTSGTRTVWITSDPIQVDRYFVQDKDHWESRMHPLLINSPDDLKKEISTVLLDLLRKSLCINTPSWKKLIRKNLYS